ncbi:MAG: tetratricopeptide repeat protein [candidate division Zixibacteria bacterium]|nr:tetratricopeptide repeat protein [candidate division Zixibacteria bacterium]NIT51879.1 tetratricopeptide repeat protein [candidate division Zixibacteria bacterium]NIW39756.1 tetratricopeptide repeat protein [candidate division Zixibacteria bacterium]NIX54679.1 tetratricopeptide repeat protein [candidate division Zixibacteria bacterium]
MLKKNIILLAIASLFLISHAAEALPPAETRTLERAQRYAELGRIDEAIKIIEPLLSRFPNDLRLLVSAHRIYLEAKDYENALKILDMQKKVSINGGRLYLDYADIFLKMGEMESADSAFQLYIRERGGGSPAYREISQAYLNNGYYAQATQIYLDGREKLMDSTQFALELGNLYQRQRQYGSAAREYFKFMVSDTAMHRTGEAQLRFLINNADDVEELKEAFGDIITSYPDRYQSYQFYAELMIREGQYDSAFENYKIVDSLHFKNGQHLYGFAEACLNDQEYEMAAKTCRYLLKKYPEQGYRERAQLSLAEALIKLGQPDSAVNVYHQVIESSPSPKLKFDGEYLLGILYLEELYQSDSARHYFNRILNTPQMQPWAEMVKIKIAESYIIDNDLDTADSIFLAINTNRLKNDMKEELLFKRAQIKFFKQEYTDARGLYNHLTGLYPRSMYVNDCLRKMLIIDENQGTDVIDLDIYADAERLLWQNEADSALTKLVDLSGRGSSNLSAMATFLAGEILYEKGEYQQALQYFNRVLESFEESFYSAESQKYLGDLYYYHFNDHEKAREAYRVILENYPNKVLYEYARRQLRKIESS